MRIHFASREHRDFYHDMMAQSRRQDCIEPEGMHGGWQTSGTVRVCQLAFNLWNGYSAERQGDEFTPNDLFCCEFAPYFMEGIKLRYPEYCRELVTTKNEKTR